MMRIRCDKQALIWTGAFAAITAGYLLGVARPQASRLRGLSRQIQSNRTAQQAGQAELDALASLQPELDRLAALAADFSLKVPHDEGLGALLEDLARFSERNHLHTERIEPGQPIRSEQVVALPIALGVRGSFPGIHGLIRDIERMPRLAQIGWLKTQTDEENPGIASAELTLRVYYQAL